jgi:hypothetical protein
MKGTDYCVSLQTSSIMLWLTVMNCYGYWYICELQLGSHPVAVVQFAFTHKQYTKQHNETEYTEQNMHNIKT